MSSEQRLEKVAEPDDPSRCQATVKTGQCPFKAIEDHKYCKMHQGGTKFNANRDNVLRTYRLAKWQARLNEFAEDEHIKSLREEIGVLRIILEEMMNKCKDVDELFLYSGKISSCILSQIRTITWLSN
jgi:hypothetical protein